MITYENVSVRHGESKFNTQRIHQHRGVELLEYGLKQAKMVAQRFSNIPIDLIFSSDYARARKTTETINQSPKKHVIFSPLLRERKRPSEIEGKAYDDPEAVRIKKLIKEHTNDNHWHYSDEENDLCIDYIWR